jgi:hypothetical protein
MKKIVFWCVLLFTSIITTWCDIEHNFMDVDNPNAKEDLKYYIWSWSFSDINIDELIPESLSWTRNDAKWQVNKIYGENLRWYVDIAKDWLSGAVQELKWYYNSWVDELNWVITDRVNEAISEELNKFKIK